MKSFASWLGWIIMLLVVGGGLVFYNLAYVPQQQRLARQEQEIKMWTTEVATLTERLKQLEASPEVAFLTVLTFDELFGGAEGFTISREGEAVLRECVPKLQEARGTVEVTGHTDNGPVPPALQDRFASNWEYAAAKAAAVVKSLAGWGIGAERLVARSCGSARPRDDNNTADGRRRNRRIEIVVRRQ